MGRLLEASVTSVVDPDLLAFTDVCPLIRGLVLRVRDSRVHGATGGTIAVVSVVLMDDSLHVRIQMVRPTR